MRDPRYWSLARRQQIALVTSLTCVGLLLGLGGAWYIRDFAERTSDRVLRASVNAVSESISLEGGRVTLQVPPDAFGMLEDSARDNVYYAVRSGHQLVTGYSDFPSSPHIPSPDETLYRYDNYLGQAVRVATQVRYLTDTHPPVVVEVAETLDARHALARQMLFGLALLEVLLVVIAAVLVSPATRWGLQPLTQLRRAIERRRSDARAFDPLEPTQAPSELQDLVVTFNALLRRLDSATKRVHEFTGDASHQMRTPLAALRMQLHRARQPHLSLDDREEALAEVDAAANRLQRLLNQLLALARAEGTLNGTTLPTNVFEVAAEAARDLAPKAAQFDMAVQLEGDNDLLVAVPPVVLVEILANLIDNAIRYGRRGGAISIRVARKLRWAIIEVEDDGPGIPETLREAVFQRFYRLPRDHQVTGSGLGLSIVGSLADVANIDIALLDGARGEGLLVRLTCLAVEADP